MKKILLMFCFYATVVTVIVAQQTKKGFGFGALPAISYDSDLGFQYGAFWTSIITVMAPDSQNTFIPYIWNFQLIQKVQPLQG